MVKSIRNWQDYMPRGFCYRECCTAYRRKLKRRQDALIARMQTIETSRKIQEERIAWQQEQKQKKKKKMPEFKQS